MESSLSQPENAFQDETPKEPEIKEYSGDFDEFKFRIRKRDKTTGAPVVSDYSLRTMFGKDRDRWLNLLSSRSAKDAEGKPTGGLKNYDNVQVILLSMCVYDSSDKLVPQDVIHTWPAPVQTDLFQKAQKMNLLGEQEKEVKNE